MSMACEKTSTGRRHVGEGEDLCFTFLHGQPYSMSMMCLQCHSYGLRKQAAARARIYLCPLCIRLVRAHVGLGDLNIAPAVL